LVSTSIAVLPFKFFEILTRDQPSADCVKQGFRFPSTLAHHATLPNNQNSPTGLNKKALVFPIPLAISVDLCIPEILVRVGPSTAAVMPMPKAPSDLYYGPVLFKHYIGSSGQVFLVQSIAIASSMEPAPYKHLGFRVLGSNPRHLLRSRQQRSPSLHVNSPPSDRLETAKSPPSPRTHG
jgi:hypothetical protein